MADESRTDLLIAHLARSFRAPVSYQFIHEGHVRRHKAADYFLRPTHRLLIGVDAQFVGFEAHEHLVTLLHAEGGAHWRGDNQAPASPQFHFLGLHRLYLNTLFRKAFSAFTHW